MYSDPLKDLLEKAIEQLSMDKDISTESKNEYCNRVNISPSQVLVLAGILGGVLDVTSVVIRKTQQVEIVLSGSLKKTEKTEMEKVMTELGKKPFDEILRAMLGSLNK